MIDTDFKLGFSQATLTGNCQFYMSNTYLRSNNELGESYANCKLLAKHYCVDSPFINKLDFSFLFYLSDDR